MTVDEYKSAIDCINNCASRVQSGLNNPVWTQETYNREKAKAEAAQAAVEKINEHHKSVRFTYQQGIEKMKYIPIYSPDLCSFIGIMAERGRYLTIRSDIYINTY